MNEIIVYGVYAFCAFLVAIYSSKEFNDPSYDFYDKEDEMAGIANSLVYEKRAKPGLPKYMIDGVRYHMYAAAFIIFAIVLFLILAWLLPIIPGVEKYFLGKPTGEGAENKQLLFSAGMAVLSALLLLGLVHFLKWPRAILFDVIKRWLHDIASIPERGREVFRSLAYDDLDVDNKITVAHIDELLEKKYMNEEGPRQDLCRENFYVGNRNTLTWKWAHLSYCIHLVEEWEKDPLYTMQLRVSTLRWKTIRNCYVQTMEQVINYRNGQCSHDEESTLNENIEEMLANCFRLMACLIFMVARPSQDPLQYVREIGYNVQEGAEYFERRGEAVRVAMAMVPAIIVMTFFFTLLPSADQDYGEAVRKILVYIEAAAILLVMPIIIVLGLKRHLSVEQSWRVVTPETAYRSFFEMPYRIYLTISVCVWVLSTVLMVLLISRGGLGGGQIEWGSMFIYSFISAITAFVTAYRVDIPRIIYKNRLSLYLGRCKVAFIQALLTALTVLTGVLLFPPSGNDNAIWMFPLMGFIVACAVSFSLFYGKHTYERRGETEREELNSPVEAVIGEQTSQAVLLNMSNSGARIKMLKRFVAEKGSEIELILENNIRKLGKVVDINLNRMHIRFT